jgi:Domain of unknown function (DUF4159)/Aerotolerance regulator N-terminal
MIFAVPLALLGLAILPPLYIILRLTPPSPRRLRFPPVSLLQNLRAAQPPPRGLPFWLLLLRLSAVTVLIFGFANPILRPPQALPGSGPVLLVIDNGWAAAATWPQRISAAQKILSAAAAKHRNVAILATARAATGTPPGIQGVFNATTAGQIISALQPEPWPVDDAGATTALRSATETTRIYLADGTSGGPAFPAFLRALRPTRILSPETLPPLLGPPSLGPNGRLTLHAISNPARANLLALSASGDILARLPFDAAGNAIIALPPPVANTIVKFTLDGPPTAGGTSLNDSSTRATRIGLATAGANAETPFLGTLYYLRRALPPGAERSIGTFAQLLANPPGLLILADIPLTGAEQNAAQAYIANGGILLRFNGPMTAATPDSLSADPLLSGDRRLGGALSWTTPETLAPFPANAPFAGLPTDPKMTVSEQVLADPTRLDPATVWATLQDGTPLVLGKAIGRGYLVNILTTANPGWSNFALSGLYPTMLARLAAIGRGIPANPALALPLRSALNAFGTLTSPGTAASLTPAARNVTISPGLPPGLYGTGANTIALNLGNHVPPPVAAALPNAARLGDPAPPRPLGPSLIAVALLILAVDLLISLTARGALKRWHLAVLAVLCLPVPAQAQSAALQTELGYILTHDQATDQISADGLASLSADVSARTSVQLGAPQALTPGTDDLSLYPLIYWPLLPTTPTPSPSACNALATYMNDGGLLVIDTPGGDATAPGSGAGFAPGAAAAVARITACLDLPPLEPLSPTNVLAHDFYIIPDFPGRFTGAPVLIATPPARDADGVTPVIIGQNDWAGAWARDAAGTAEQSLLPGGEAQRVIADRFGINLVIYALTGSYKADQVFAPTVLDKLGQ